MSIPFLSVKPKSVKLKVSPRFPAQLVGRTAIDVIKSNGNYYIDLDLSEFAQAVSLPPNPYTIVFDPTLNAYSLVPPSVFTGTITEAPIDGFTYGRASTNWARVVPLAGGTMTGPLLLNSDPALPLGAVTKQYVDNGGGTILPLVNASVAVVGTSTKWAHEDHVHPIFPLRSYLAGLPLSTAGSSPTFSVAVGQAIDNSNFDMMILGSSINKTTGPWAVGTGNGGFDTNAAVLNLTWYHVYLIKRPDTQVVDVCFSASATAPTIGGQIPAAYTMKRRIGAMRTDGSGNWTLFRQNGDEFLWDVRVIDASLVAIAATTATPRTLTVPTGLQVNALFNVRLNFVTNNVSFLITSLDESDQVPGIDLASLIVSTTSTNAAGHFNIRTNTTAQIRVRGNTTGPTYSIATYGWIDRRGKDA